MPFGYRSLGVDTYASGEAVLDGECYALVWTRSGFGFSGYTRDGALADPANNAQVYVRSLAKDGCCPPVNFVVSEQFLAAHAGGTYAVVVLDTRCARGTLAGLNESNALWRVNGWGLAKVRRVETAKLALAASGSSAASVSDSSGSRITTAAKVPDTCRKPVITAFSFDAEGNAVVECVGTERYLSYMLEAGASPEKVGEAAGSDRQDGSGTDDAVRLKVKRDELGESGAGFFRVKAVTEL